MKIDFYKEKERFLTMAKESIGDAVENLEHYLPDMAEELCWIGENLLSEILTARSTAMELADADLTGGAFA